MTSASAQAQAPPPGPPADVADAAIVLSFDVEEHHRIEAASGLDVGHAAKRHYLERVGPATRWLLDQLDQSGHKATFFIVGELARDDPGLVQAVHRAGHEVASHGWDHRRIVTMTPEVFREDLRLSCDVLEQITGEAVAGYRAPTFSVLRRTAWALDLLAERGLLYDSSIYPVRHDRYGVPGAPRGPFLAQGAERSILELPPVTLRVGRSRVPMGGGGYFRLLPLAVTEQALNQTRRECDPPVAMLYFHPWEFDPDQPRLPLRPLSRFRTYVGIGRGRRRLSALLARRRFARAVDVARRLDCERLPIAEIETC